MGFERKQISFQIQLNRFELLDLGTKITTLLLHGVGWCSQIVFWSLVVGKRQDQSRNRGRQDEEKGISFCNFQRIFWPRYFANLIPNNSTDIGSALLIGNLDLGCAMVVQLVIEFEQIESNLSGYCSFNEEQRVLICLGLIAKGGCFDGCE